MQRGEPAVGDEGLPVHGQDVPVSLSQPGDGLVVEVVDLALQEGRPSHLSSEHQVRRPVEERNVEAQELVEVLAGRQHEEEGDENQLSLDGHGDTSHGGGSRRTESLGWSRQCQHLPDREPQPDPLRGR